MRTIRRYTERWRPGEGERFTEAEAYGYCKWVTKRHYENFPVGSALVPRTLRKHVYAIYAFSRAADDMADEGGMPVEERLGMLDDWERQLREAYQGLTGQGGNPVFIALAATVGVCNIPMELLLNLLSAFRQDARNEGFKGEEDLLDYCSRSANPIGRLVLHVFGVYTEEGAGYSDSICTGLQLINFWQDVSVDTPRGRINIPRDVLKRFGYRLEELNRGEFNPQFRSMMEWLTGRAEEFLKGGGPLPGMIPDGRLWRELRLTLLGGLGIARMIKEQGYNVLKKRPALRSHDKVKLIISAILSGKGPRKGKRT